MRAVDIGHLQPQIRDRGPIRCHDVPIAVDFGSSAAHRDQRKRIRSVRLTVAHARAVEDQRVVEDGAVTFGHRLELLHEAREQLRRQFSELCQEIAGALDQDPAGPRAQELAGRWLQLLAAFSPTGGGDPQMLKYGAASSAEGAWPAGAARPDPPFGKPVWEFMAKAIAVRR